LERATRKSLASLTYRTKSRRSQLKRSQSMKKTKRGIIRVNNRLMVASLIIGNADPGKVIIITGVAAVDIDGKITTKAMTDNIITNKVKGSTRMVNEKGHIFRTPEGVHEIRKGLRNRGMNTTIESSTSRLKFKRTQTIVSTIVMTTNFSKK